MAFGLQCSVFPLIESADPVSDVLTEWYKRPELEVEKTRPADSVLPVSPYPHTGALAYPVNSKVHAIPQ